MWLLHGHRQTVSGSTVCCQLGNNVDHNYLAEFYTPLLGIFPISEKRTLYLVVLVGTFPDSKILFKISLTVTLTTIRLISSTALQAGDQILIGLTRIEECDQ